MSYNPTDARIFSPVQHPHSGALIKLFTTGCVPVVAHLEAHFSVFANEGVGHEEQQYVQVN